MIELKDVEFEGIDNGFGRLCKDSKKEISKLKQLMLAINRKIYANAILKGKGENAEAELLEYGLSKHNDDEFMIAATGVMSFYSSLAYQKLVQEI